MISKRYFLTLLSLRIVINNQNIHNNVLEYPLQIETTKNHAELSCADNV